MPRTDALLSCLYSLNIINHSPSARMARLSPVHIDPHHCQDEDSPANRSLLHPSGPAPVIARHLDIFAIIALRHRTHASNRWDLAELDVFCFANGGARGRVLLQDAFGVGGFGVGEGGSLGCTEAALVEHRVACCRAVDVGGRDGEWEGRFEAWAESCGGDGERELGFCGAGEHGCGFWGEVR